MAAQLTPEEDCRYRERALEWALKIFAGTPPDAAALIQGAQAIYEFLVVPQSDPAA
jgi:hypothetical protein